MINDDCYKFLKLDIVSDTNNIISVYSWFEILDKFFESFRTLRYGNDKMINSMNNEYTFVDKLNKIKNSMINPWFRKIFVSEFNWLILASFLLNYITTIYLVSEL